MNRWKTPLIVLVLGSFLAVGGTMLYVRSQVKSALKDAVAAAALFADIDYGNVSVGLGGNIHIYDIDVRPRSINDRIRIEGIDIETPGLWFLVTGKKKMQDGKVPERLRIDVRGMQVNIGGAITDTLDRFLAMAAEASGGQTLSNCGELRRLDLKAHRRLGYESLVFDLSLGYRFEKRGPLHVVTEWRTRELAGVTVDLEFSSASPTVNELMATQPRLRTFTIDYQDLSFTDKLKRYCAQASGMTAEQYIDAEVNRTDALYQASWGFVPGPGLRDAYRDFLTKPGEVRLKGNPPSEVDMQALRLFKPDDVVSMLNLRISVNGKPVPDLSMTTLASPETPDEKPAADTTAARDAIASAAKPAAAAPTRTVKEPAVAPSTRDAASDEPQFRAVPTKELARYVNKTVRLTLTRGAVREGYLLQIANGMARVERRYQAGNMTLAIPLREIERAEVLF